VLKDWRIQRQLNYFVYTGKVDGNPIFLATQMSPKDCGFYNQVDWSLNNSLRLFKGEEKK
jgi:hypothetical protein